MLDEFVPDSQVHCRPDEACASDSIGATRRGFRLDPAVEAETIRLYQEHQSLRKVGALLGITQEAVRLRLRNAGVDCSRRGLLTREEQDRAAALYDELRSVQAVASRLGRSPATARKALAQAGVVVRPWWQWQAEARTHHKNGEARMIKRLYDRFGSQVAVAQALGVSQQLVCQRLAFIGASPGRGRRPATRPPNSEIFTRLAALYESGFSARQAAERVGVAHHTALRWLRLAGFDTSRRAMLERRRDAA